MTFTIYFEIYGKRLKVNVEATDEEHASRIVRNKLTIHKVERKYEAPPKPDKKDAKDLFEFLNGLRPVQLWLPIHTGY